jgi:LmeA-like phospholipid-binding
MLLARRRAARIALLSVGGVVVVLGLAQLLLPGLAARRVRSQLGRYGVVRSTSVSAFPAVELLWGRAQSVSASATRIGMSLSQASALLWQGRGVDRLDVSAQSLRLETLALHGVLLRKRGSALYIEGSITQAALRAALPGSTEVLPLGSIPGGVQVRVTGTIFGAVASVDVLLLAEDGRLVAQPQGIPFAGSLRLTLLSAPHVYLQSFALSPSVGEASGTGGASYRVRIWARLR